MTGAARNTITTLLVQLGTACAAYQDRKLRFLTSTRTRLMGRVQITTDGHKAYLQAVEDAFGGEVDYAQLVKLYGASPESAKGKYSPADCIGARKDRIEGNPDMAVD